MRWRRAIPGLAAVVVCAIAVSLGNWQTRRGEEKLQLQRQYDQALAAAAVSVNDAARLAALPAQLPRRVRLAGEFLGDATVYIDNRLLDGVAGFQVVTALRVAPDLPLVLVDRGWAVRDMADRTRLPSAPAPAGAVTIEGLAIAHLPRTLELGAEPAVKLGIWQNLDYERFERATGQRVVRAVVQQTDGPADGLRRERPRLDAGVDRHRGYALQWYGLAVLAVVLAIFYGVRARRAAA